MADKKYDKYMAVEKELDNGMEWHSPDESPLVLEGFPWRKKGGPFRRMPQSSKSSPLPEGVDCFANHAAGGQLRFKTDSSSIMIKTTVVTRSNAADIMTYGRFGFDIYVGGPMDKRFAGVTRLNFDDFHVGESSYCSTVFASGSKQLREFTLNFPLYASVEKLSLGFVPGSKIEAPSPRRDVRPVVVYGTSIQQGCCASRPGLCHTNLMSRSLNRPFINLGFSGSGKGEPEVARVLASIKNPALYILDYDSNSSLKSLAETLPGFTDILLAAHPETPILTVSKMQYNSPFATDCDDVECVESRSGRTEIHLANVKRCRAKGCKNVHFLDGLLLFGGEDIDECTTDACHANDLGFYRMAKVMAPEIERILQA